MSAFVDNLHHLLGFIAVVVVLTALWIITAGIGTLFKRQAEANKKPGPGAVVAGGPGKLQEEEIIAVTAAVYALIGHHSRIVSIKSGSGEWSRAGRQEHFASHRVR